MEKIKTLTTHIGFPPPLLGAEPHRLPVVASGPGWLVLDKPVGPLIDAHPWYPGAPSLVAGLRVQAEAGKPELEPFAISHVAAVHFLEAEATGLALITLDRDRKAELRNLVGSSLVTFRYRFFVRKQPDGEVCECSLPLSGDDAGCQAVINRKKGKKSHTAFRRIMDYGLCAEWEATTTLPRPHQVRLHARESGLSLIGDTLYDGSSSPLVGDILGQRAGERAANPLFPGLALRLVSLELPGQTITAPELKGLQAARRLLTEKK